MDFLLEKTNKLKIKANNAEDLYYISSFVQDSLFPLSCIHYEKEKGQFKILLNRFRWEIEGHHHEGAPLYARVHTALYFEGVTHVDYHGIQPDDPLRMLNLLAIHIGEGGYIYLVCSGNAVLRLHAKKISCHLQDLHDHWPTRGRPSHAQAAA